MFVSKSGPLSFDQIRQYAPAAFQTAAHESRSNRYGVQSTTEILEALRSEGFQVFGAGQSRTRQDNRIAYTKHLLRLRHVSTFENGLSKVGDSIPEVLLVNSFDGSSQYEISAGVYRMVCENGMVVADSLIQTVKVRHTINSITGVLEASYEVAKQTERAMGVIDEWKSLNLTHQDRLSLAYDAHSSRFADADGKVNTPITAEQMLHIHREADRGTDLWRTFNTIQENAVRGGLRGRNSNDDGTRGRRVQTREVKGISQNISLNKTLWEQSSAMADLKSGRLALRQAKSLSVSLAFSAKAGQ